MAFEQLARVHHELARRWAHLPPKAPLAQAVPADAVAAAVRRVQHGQAEAIDAELLARSLAQVTKFGIQAEAAVERYLRKVGADGEYWLLGLTDPALPGARRVPWLNIAAQHGSLTAAELALAKWVALHEEFRGPPSGFVALVPPAQWSSWLADHGLRARLLVPLAQSLLLYAETFPPANLTPAPLQNWLDSHDIPRIMSRTPPNLAEIRRIGGRLLSACHALLQGRVAQQFRAEVRKAWLELDPVGRASMRKLTAAALGLSDADFARLRRLESDAEFDAFLVDADQDYNWRGMRGDFWRRERSRLHQLGYYIDRSAHGDRLVLTLDDGRFAVEFLDAGPLLFFDEGRVSKELADRALGPMRSNKFRETCMTWNKVDHRGNWYPRAVDALIQFAGARK